MDTDKMRPMSEDTVDKLSSSDEHKSKLNDETLQHEIQRHER
ncbi:hypothetical protein [Desulfovibrio litoralis]|uniref:Uncharacterized protein n=1 Tax=Desulfovibrio litoralis DSM 11393 TaxID=1121455 RepID=A0A1M7S7G7_9BACT|nr:hypothetical protein [Desulfovibrio litoralis]SHN54411.1 hypothetical protein SAMN02745728_00533 [Desulfovibrio litoralis DSM 11393]